MANRTVAAVFRGEGTFSFAPGSAIEQERLARFEKTKTLESPFTDLVLLFADSTLAELNALLKFGPAPIPSTVRERAKASLEYLADKESRSFQPDLMSTFLNGDTTALFYAHVVRTKGPPLMFMLNPNEVEAVRLYSKVSKRSWKRESEVVCQFPRQGWTRDPRIHGERTRQADIQRYTIETWLPPTGIGELGFSAAAKLEIVADTAVGPWVVFELFEKLRVDSARWDGGGPAAVFRGKDSELLWVSLDHQIRPGDVRTLNLYYRGDLIDRIVDFFHIKSSIAWYPLSLEGRSLARFELIFNTDKAYQVASVGDRVDSSATGRLVRTRWVTPGPIRNASFNLGLFKEHRVQEAEIPPVTVMLSEEAHRKLAGVFMQQRKMQEIVAADVTKSLRFFQSVYGPAPVKHFYATEIPGFHGEAFPGMVHLSWVTFQNTDKQGHDELFRAHEVAHQWWGIGVDYFSYRDRWLSEGFADFSGLWYLQTVRKDNEKYFEMLRRWRSSIMLRKAEPGPIWLGHRVVATKDDELNDYQTIVYQKGAWVLHMLRILMLDLKDMNESRFTETMRDFYASYQGRRASTEDFRKVVEKHARTDMGWFFNQWVYSAALPTYRVAYGSVPAENGQYRVKLRVRQENVPDDFQMYVPVTLDLGKDRKARFRVKVKGPLSEIELPLLPAQPKNLKFNDMEGVLAEVKTEGWGS
ncbi:MAG: M1 family metallopeptidase [Gemmatimonadales bacterium]